MTFDKFQSSRPLWVKKLRSALRDGKTAVLANRTKMIGEHSSSEFYMIENPESIPSEFGTRTTSTVKALFAGKGPSIQIESKNQHSTTYLQLLRDPELSVAVIGDSAVARALIEQLLLLPARITWISEQHPDAHDSKLTTAIFSDQAISGLTGNTKIAIATSNHELDIRCCHLALGNKNLGYIGCLGSLKKAQLVKARLTAMGIPANRLAQLAMPIGLESISGKHPSIIAASIVAQILCES